MMFNFFIQVLSTKLVLEKLLKNFLRKLKFRRHDTQHNNIKNNDTQDNNTQHKDT